MFVLSYIKLEGEFLVGGFPCVGSAEESGSEEDIRQQVSSKGEKGD